MSTNDLKNMGFASKQIHAGHMENTFGALAAPIYQTSTFVFDSAEQGGKRFAGQEDGYIYSRMGNPTVRAVEEKVACLENGEDCVAASSGMGAITSAIWSVVKAGDHIVAGKTLYGCTFAFLTHGLARFGVDVTLVDTRDSENVKKAMKPNTKLVYLESPANPNMYLADIEKISAIAHETNPECKVMVDNTYMTPYIQRPLELGADIVVHSATKYLNGHGDVVAGFVVGKKDMMDEVRSFGIKDMTGSTLGPFEAFLIARGMKTLDIRMEKHCANAQKVAEFLETHPAVESIAFPGLPSFPQAELVKKQMKLSGAMIAFTVKGGLEAGRKLMNSVKFAALAVSLGDAETLIQHPASMTHSAYSAEELVASDIAEGLVRLSVGLEDAKDIIADLKQALDSL